MNARHVVPWLGGNRLVAHEAQTQGLDAPNVAVTLAKRFGMMVAMRDSSNARPVPLGRRCAFGTYLRCRSPSLPVVAQSTHCPLGSLTDIKV